MEKISKEDAKRTTCVNPGWSHIKSAQKRLIETEAQASIGGVTVPQSTYSTYIHPAPDPWPPHVRS